MNKTTLILTILIIVATFTAAYALMPPNPDVITDWKDRGILDKKMKELKDASLRLTGSRTEDDPSVYGKYGRKIAHIGNLKALVVLVEFPEGDFLLHKPESTIAYYEELLFETGKINNGRPTFRDFFLENSKKKLDITGSVIGWYQAKHELTYYTNWNGGVGGGSRTSELISECVDYAEEWFEGDLTRFDNDGPDNIPRSEGSMDDDGMMDLFFVIHAGLGDESSGTGENFWSLFSPFFGKAAGGIEVSGYSINGEYAGYANDYNPCVFINGCGRWFGLPNLYDLDGDSSGIGSWGMMGSGWSCASFTPWSKAYLGWLSEDDGTLINIVGNPEGVEIPDIHREDSNVYRLWANGEYGPEYFLVENRQKQTEGIDGFLPGSGLLIWHVDESVPPSGGPNDNQDRPLLKLMQCDGNDDLYYMNNWGDSTDPWPCDKKDFDGDSNPSSRSYDGDETGVAVKNISLSGEIMTADFKVSDGIIFGLHLSPEKEAFTRGDIITLSWDLYTPPVPVRCDIYLVLLDSRNMLYFAPRWKTIAVPVIPDFVLPPDWKIENSPILFFPVPCSKPPIGFIGQYLFAIGAAKPGTADFISNIATASFEIK